MNIDSIITEWTYRLEKGYPDSPEDYQELRNVLQEMTDLSDSEQNVIVRRAMGLTEDEQDSNTEEPLPTSEDIKFLVRTISNVAQPYARYLKIFSLFDPNSLGTISEVLLAQLINKEGGSAIQVGGSQGLTDVIIKSGKTEKRISLKTTAAGAPINLGSDLKTANIENINTVLSYAKSKFFEDAGYRELTITQLLKAVPEIDAYKTQHIILKNEIENRIEAIANKLSGQDEYFIWAEKKTSTVEGQRVISSIIIHVLNYDKQDVIKRLYDGKFFVSKDYTGVSWGIKDNNNRGMVGADKDGKYLNILPAFVKDTNQKEQRIKINLDLAYVNLEGLTPQQLVSNSFLNILNIISDSLFGEPISGQATDGENDNLTA